MGQATQAVAREREAKALELAKAGNSYEKIAQELGYAGREGAWKAVKRSLDRLTKPAAEDYRAMQLERLNTMRLGLWPKVQKGGERATEVALRIEEREAKLLGLDAPEQLETKQDITVTVVGIDPEDI